MKIVVMTYLGKLEQYHSSFYHRTPPRLILPSQILLCIWKSKHHHELFSWIGHLVFLTSNFHHIPLLKYSLFITLISKPSTILEQIGTLWRSQWSPLQCTKLFPSLLYPRTQLNLYTAPLYCVVLYGSFRPFFISGRLSGSHFPIAVTKWHKG